MKDNVELNTVKESTPLIPKTATLEEKPLPSSCRVKLYNYMEAKETVYEYFTIFLIVINVICFTVGSLFIVEYSTSSYKGACDERCDAIFFGNYENELSFLNIGPTSLVELVTVFVFTIDYLLRFLTADLEHESYQGFFGRINFVFSFFSLVDLISIVPFYIDVILVERNLASVQFLRIFRLLRMMKLEGRYKSALTLFDDVFYEQRAILGTALFIGITTWVGASTFYYLVERKNLDLIYCNGCDFEVQNCGIDSWGFVECTECSECFHLFRSIPSALYFTLLNLSGEFPLIDQHSAWGKVVGTVVAVLASMAFAIPVGVIGAGFGQILGRQQDLNEEEQDTSDFEIMDVTLAYLRRYYADDDTCIGLLYNFFHGLTNPIAQAYNLLINFFVLGTIVTYALETLEFFYTDAKYMYYLRHFEYVAVCIFTFDYIAKLYSIAANPEFALWNKGRLGYMKCFLTIVDLLSFAPFWIAYFCISHMAPYSNVVKLLRLLRVFRFERYTRAFTTLDEVLRYQYDVLTVTGVAAIILWIVFSAIMYWSERDNPDSDTQVYYTSVPDAMWMTLLNLSGESPLCHYSLSGRITTGLLAIFATGLFGIPIGLIGSGFDEYISEQVKDTPDPEPLPAKYPHPGIHGNCFQRTESAAHKFVNGRGCKLSNLFEMLIYALILATVGIGILQTVDGFENTWHQVEWFAVIIFSFEYLVRLFGAAADDNFCNCYFPRINYVFSFFSIIDLLATIPMYIVYFYPGGWLDAHDEYLRMLRLIRLITLDKYIPSISLIDDVFRLKRESLIVTAYAAVSLWIVFSGLLYLFEYQDINHEIDAVPQYGCDEDCTMSDRWQSYFDSLVYTMVHLTGDYPIVEYSTGGRIVCFFMVIVAVGIVSIPSGLIAGGFQEVVESKIKTDDDADGNDWYENQLALLKKNNTPPPLSWFGSCADKLQMIALEFLNGKETDKSTGREWSFGASIFRNFFFLLIIGNIFAVLLESVPEIDQYVGNEQGNAFDMFEMVSVIIFSLEYFLRLFSAPKSRDALYSSLVYASTFFGIVDLLSIAPWYIEQYLYYTGSLDRDSSSATVFRIFRIFRILQLEDFIIAFSKLDNAFRKSKDVLRATGLMALIIWVGCAALFFIFEKDSVNWRECDDSIPLTTIYDDNSTLPGCFDFKTVQECNNYYGQDMCSQSAFVNMPDSLYFTAVFLGGEWGLIDFTWPGRFVCMFLCIAGIALYSLPVGTLFESFGESLGIPIE